MHITPMLLCAKSVNSSSFSYSIFTSPEQSIEIYKSIYTVVKKLSSFRQYLQNVYSCSRLFLWGCCTQPESTHCRLVLRQWKARLLLANHWRM